MKTVTLHGRRFELYKSAEEIQEAIVKVAGKLKADLKDKEAPLFVCIMNGAFMFASELCYALDETYEVRFARYSSYEGTQSTNVLKEIMPVGVPIEGRTVVIVEDLIDTGYTLKCLKEKYEQEGAKEVIIVSMLSKPEALKCDIKADYVAMEIETKFIVGHGLDFDDEGRMLKDIYQIVE